MPTTSFRPNYVVHPGAVLAEYLDVAGMSQAELATRCDRPTKTISEIIHGKASITPETAIQFERVLGRPAALWNNLQANFDLRREALEQDAALTKQVSWTKRFPLTVMRREGWIDANAKGASLVESLLRFFGVASPEAYDNRWETVPVAFRKSSAYATDPQSLAVWLRRGEQLAVSIETRPFDAERARSVVAACRAWTTLSFEDGFRSACEAFADAGVAVVVVPHIPKTCVSGAARWLSKDRALIQLSLRFKKADHAWFTLLHEAGHILLHGKRELFVDDPRLSSGSDAQERQADEFARNALISPDAYEDFVAAKVFSQRAVTMFAARMGTSPGIVVGRLQHERVIAHSELNALRTAIDPAAIASASA